MKPSNNNCQKYYKGLDGIRAFAALCIIIMHVYANFPFEFKNTLTENIKHFFADFVFLFMILSGFSVCCGYYNKIKNQKISINDFYLRRYKRIWPFFMILVVIDLIISMKLPLIYEGIANSTLLFGFLPNPKLEVIGVGWFVGVVFAFYIFFPFLIFAFWNKRRAWLSLFISFVIAVICSTYFFEPSKVGISFDPRTNILYCLFYFALGIVIFLYKENISQISKVAKLIVMAVFLISITIFVIRPNILEHNDCILIILRGITFSSFTILGITTSNNILNNSFTNYISSISMQLYLCHMIAFRIIEKTELFNILGSGWRAYCISVILVILLAIVIQFIIEKIISFIKIRISYYSVWLKKGEGR